MAKSFLITSCRIFERPLTCSALSRFRVCNCIGETENNLYNSSGVCINLFNSSCVSCINNQNQAGWSNRKRKRTLIFFSFLNISPTSTVSRSPFYSKCKSFLLDASHSLLLFLFFLKMCLMNYLTVHNILTQTVFSLVLFVSTHLLHYVLCVFCVQGAKSQVLFCLLDTPGSS